MQGTGSLTPAQADRRDRVIRATLQLGAQGGYDAVQMRDVAATADVAIGTLYRYFSSKDHLLAAALVTWTGDLEQQVARRPPKGSTLAERLASVLQRATRAMEREPQLTSALITAISSPDPGAASCQDEVRAAMSRVMASTLPVDFDPDVRAQVIRVLNFVWYGALLGWVNGWKGTDSVGREVTDATHLLLDQFS